MDIETISPTLGDEPFLSFDFGSRGAPKAILSTLASGDMTYAPAGESAARQAFFRSLGIERERVFALRLIHSRRVVAQRKGEAPAIYPGDGEGASSAELTERDGMSDGFVSEEGHAVPALTVADCMPIWLFDSGRARQGAFGLLHSGWKGTGILKEAVMAMEDLFGAEPGDLSVILGPCIGACCYEVPAERAAAFAAEFGEDSVLRSNRGGRESTRLDLRAANIRIAERLGIGKLLDVRLCTSCSPKLGSYRRQGPQGFTRMLALCGHF